jgi:phosphonate transport system substrate-binding protein
MSMKRLLCTAALLLALPTASRAEELKLGLLPRLSATELTTMFKPLADHLARETGHKVTLVIPKDFDAFQKAVEAGEMDLAFSNPLVYVQAKKTKDLAPLAVAVEKKGGTKFRGIFVVRKDSGIDDVKALKGKRLIFVDEDSLGGYICQALMLKKQGYDLQKDFVRLPYAKKHDNVTMAVINKAADAGGIREDDLDKMAGKVDLSQLKVLAYTEYFPNWPLFASPKVPAATRDALKAALLKLKAGDPALEAAKLTGFGPIADKEYDGLRDAAKTVGAF